MTTHSLDRRRTVTRDRLLDEGLRLFARQGFEATSVGDLQAAVGTSRGSGALYKHFPSKEAVLRAAVARHAARAAAVRASIRLPAHEPTVEDVGRWILAELAGEADLMRVLVREADRFPDLAAAVREQVIASTYDLFAEWLRQRGLGRPRPVAAVAVSALVHFRLDQALLGITPGGVSEARFLRAWVAMVTAAIEGGGS